MGLCFCVGIQFVRHARGFGFVLHIPFQEPHRLLKIAGRNDLAVEQVIEVRGLERQCSMQAQAESFNA